MIKVMKTEFVFGIGVMIATAFSQAVALLPAGPHEKMLAATPVAFFIGVICTAYYMSKKYGSKND